MHHELLKEGSGVDSLFGPKMAKAKILRNCSVMFSRDLMKSNTTKMRTNHDFKFFIDADERQS